MGLISVLPATSLISCYSRTIHRQLQVCVFVILVGIGQVFIKNAVQNRMKMHATGPHISMKARKFASLVILTVLSVQVRPRTNVHTAHSIDNSFKTPMLQQAPAYRAIVIVMPMQIRQAMYVNHMIVPVAFTLTPLSMAKNQFAVNATLLVQHVHQPQTKTRVPLVLTTVR